MTAMSRDVGDLFSLLLERHIHQQLVALDVDDVAECALAATGKVEIDPAVPDAQVADAQLIEERRQRGVNDIQLFAGRAGADSQHRGQEQEDRAGSPGLRRTGHGILYRFVTLAPLDSAKKLRQAIVAEVERGLEQGAENPVDG